jgi:hypothetical protein
MGYLTASTQETACQPPAAPATDQTSRADAQSNLSEARIFRANANNPLISINQNGGASFESPTTDALMPVAAE